jgi:hypothetical protein
MALSQESNSITGLHLRERLLYRAEKFISRTPVQRALRILELPLFLTSQVGCRVVCTALEGTLFVDTLTNGVMHKIPEKVGALGIWAFAKYFQWYGYPDFYRRYVPDSKSALYMDKMFGMLRRARELPSHLEEAFDSTMMSYSFDEYVLNQPVNIRRIMDRQ